MIKREGNLMYLRLKFGLALAVVLGVMIGAGGCARKPAKVNAGPKTPDKKIVITCTIMWQGGNLGVDKLEVTMEPSPKSADGPGTVTIPLKVSPTSVPPEQQAMLKSTQTFTTMLSLGGAEAYIVKVAPIPGWKVTPSEYRASKKTNKADFKLEKIKQ
jgi:hypothetical protein